MDRFPSTLVSLILHLTVFALALFWPDSVPEQPKMGGLVVQGYVTLGKESAPVTPKAEDIAVTSPEAQPEELPLPQPEEAPTKQEEVAPVSTETPDIQNNETPAKIEPRETPTVEPAPEQEKVETPKVEEVPPPAKLKEIPEAEAKEETSVVEVKKPDPKKEIVPPKKEENPSPIKTPTEKEVASTKGSEPKSVEKDPIEPEKRKEEKKVPEQITNATKKAPLEKNSTNPVKKEDNTVKAPNQVKSTPPVKKQEKKKTPTEKKKDALSDALKDIAKTTPKEKVEVKKRRSSDQLVDVLDDIKKQTQDSTSIDETGTNSGGSGGTGIGIVTQAYAEVVGQAIKRNWKMASRADRQELFATMRIYLSKDGTIEKYEMLRSSGDRLFDSSLSNAIASTNTIPEPPPTQNEQVIDVNFYP